MFIGDFGCLEARIQSRFPKPGVAGSNPAEGTEPLLSHGQSLTFVGWACRGQPPFKRRGASRCAYVTAMRQPEGMRESAERPASPTHPTAPIARGDPGDGVRATPRTGLGSGWPRALLLIVGVAFFLRPRSADSDYYRGEETQWPLGDSPLGRVRRGRRTVGRPWTGGHRVGWILSATGLALLISGAAGLQADEGDLVGEAVGGAWLTWFFLVGLLMYWFPTWASGVASVALDRLDGRHRRGFQSHLCC